MTAVSAPQVTDRLYAHRPQVRYALPGDDRSKRACGPSQAAATASLDCIATLITYRRGERVCEPSTTRASLHCVVSGVAKKFAPLQGGRQQTIDLFFPGEFFTLDPRYADGLVVEVLSRVFVMAEYRQHEVEKLAACRPDVRAFLAEVAFGDARRLQRHVLTMSHLRTTQKVGALLLELAERLPERNAESVSLPLSRYDIADYLGLAVESVSRSLSKLKSQGAIRMTGPRRIKITDRAALES